MYAFTIIISRFHFIHCLFFRLEFVSKLSSPPRPSNVAAVAPCKQTRKATSLSQDLQSRPMQYSSSRSSFYVAQALHDPMILDLPNLCKEQKPAMCNTRSHRPAGIMTAASRQRTGGKRRNADSRLNNICTLLENGTSDSRDERGWPRSAVCVPLPCLLDV